LDTLLAAGAVRADADVASLATADVPDPAGLETDLARARLDLAPGVVLDPAVARPLVAYALGHATGDPAHFRAAFLPTAHVEGHREGAFASWGLDDYTALFDGSPAEDEPDRRRRIEAVDVRGRVGTARMSLAHGASAFTDCFVLLASADGEWRIANKVYERVPQL
ncbi:nuclear transport factor 2 family protein, partial [Nocardioides sp.]|uniref:nuclear transport factor 2 family protein n=1 Tax=Nocardioides sp. TaxID=35761 RepID=UPI002EDB5F2D